MAQPPVFRPFRLDSLTDDEDAPSDVVSIALRNQSTSMSETVNALSKGITRADNLAGTDRVGATFSTPSSGAMSVTVAHGMSSTPTHVVVTNLARKDGTPLAVWSYNWASVAGGNVLLTFQGLVASTNYVFSCTFD